AGLAKSGMTYAPADLMDPQAWRGPDGSYDFGFQAACRAQMQDREVLFETLGATQATLDDDEPARSGDRAWPPASLPANRRRPPETAFIAPGRRNILCRNVYL